MNIKHLTVNANDLEEIEEAWGTTPKDNHVVGLICVYIAGLRQGFERSATYLDDQFYDRGPLATALRTLRDGGQPCEDCGYALPTHDPSCVSRNMVDET